jgi:hypothetical protein
VAINPGYFKPGEVANPNGRPKGSRNKRTEDLWSKLEARGDKDPADVLSAIASSENETKELRVQAANCLLPYKYGKHGSIIAPRYIEEPVDLPRPTTVAQANSNIALISEMKAQGRIDLDFANSLIADNRVIADNIIAEEELKLKLANNRAFADDTTIHITGGLPPLPGCDVIMPVINGTNGHVIEHEARPAIEAAPQSTQAQETNAGPQAEDPQP